MVMKGIDNHFAKTNGHCHAAPTTAAPTAAQPHCMPTMSTFRQQMNGTAGLGIEGVLQNCSLQLQHILQTLHAFGRNGHLQNCSLQQAAAHTFGQSVHY